MDVPSFYIYKLLPTVLKTDRNQFPNCINLSRHGTTSTSIMVITACLMMGDCQCRLDATFYNELLDAMCQNRVSKVYKQQHNFIPKERRKRYHRVYETRWIIKHTLELDVKAKHNATVNGAHVRKERNKIYSEKYVPLIHC
jgi:hypothetical protein